VPSITGIPPAMACNQSRLDAHSIAHFRFLCSSIFIWSHSRTGQICGVGWMVWETGSKSLREIGELFGGLDYAAVAQRIRRTKSNYNSFGKFA
jgi:hypothetical protein